MINVKEAAKTATKYFVDLYAAQSYSNILLEEVEYNEDDNAWLITLGYSPPLVENPLSPLVSFSHKERNYKIFRIDAETGTVLSMKIRPVEHA